MNRKDIALTVGGSLASLSLAFLFYRQQKREASEASTAAVDPAYTISDGSTVTYYGSDGYYPYQLSSISVPSIAASVSVSGDTAGSGSSGTSVHSEDAVDMITKIVSAFQSGSNPNILPNYVQTDPYAAALANIPTTATDALTQANAAHPGITAVHDTTATFANSTMPRLALTSTNPIVTVSA